MGHRTAPVGKDHAIAHDGGRRRGAGDWLERIALHLGDPKSGTAAGVPLALGRWFERLDGQRCTVRNAFAGDLERRLSSVEALLSALHGRGGSRLATEPAVVALFTEERECLRYATVHAVASREVTRALASLKQRLYACQRQAVDRFIDGGWLLLGDDMGLGKTAQVTTGCHVLYEAERVRRGPLIVPAALKP